MHYASLACNSTHPHQHTLQSIYNHFNHWILNYYLDSLGSKDLLQPAFGPTLARAIRTLIGYVIFAHSAPVRTRMRTSKQLKRFIVLDITDWASENPHIEGQKSHIGQKKCFTSKYREKCIYFVLNGVYSLLWTFDTHKKYIFSESSQSKDSTGTAPKMSDTGCANYTGWHIKIIMHFRQLKYPYL